MFSVDQTADQLIALINSSPRSPRKDEILAILGNHSTERVKSVAAVPGASVTIWNDGCLRFQGWQITYAVPVALDQQAQIESCLAIVEWLRQKVLRDLAGVKGD